jgi:hypothetical protein
MDETERLRAKCVLRSLHLESLRRCPDEVAPEGRIAYFFEDAGVGFSQTRHPAVCNIDQSTGQNQAHTNFTPPLSVFGLALNYEIRGHSRSDGE